MDFQEINMKPWISKDGELGGRDLGDLLYDALSVKIVHCALKKQPTFPVASQVINALAIHTSWC